MDPILVAKIALLAYRVLNDEQGTFQRDTQEALTRLQGSVDSLVAAPLHEGLSRLRQGSIVDNDRRRQLLEEARGKFCDAAAREAAPAPLRTNAAALAALCWAALEEPALAAAEVRQAEMHAGKFLQAERARAKTDYSESDPMWRRLDEAERLGLQVGRLSDLVQGRQDAIDTTGELALPALVSVDLATVGRQAPTRRTCDFLGGCGPEKLESVWHRLRELLAEGEEVRWFAEATNLRLLATSESLVVYDPNDLKSFGKPKVHWPLTDIRVAQEGREWFDSFIVLACMGRVGGQRINLGPEGHARTLTLRLRRSLKEATT